MKYEPFKIQHCLSTSNDLNETVGDHLPFISQNQKACLSVTA